MRPTLLLFLAAFALPADAQTRAGPFTVVESGRSYASLQDAVSAIGGGTGTIRIAPGLYHDCAVQQAGRIAYVAAVPGQVIFERAICEDKAALVLRGRAASVDGIVFRLNKVSDGNGAGIRIEQGDLTVTNAMFLDDQCGILSAVDPNGHITVDRSTFAGLGDDPTGTGAHAIYVGGYGSLRVTRSRFERGVGGHYVKSRAPVIEVLDSSFDDSRGHATNYMIDLSNGAVGRIAGNSFAQGPAKDNAGTMITIAPEGVKNRSAGLVIEGNKAWLTQGARPTTFVGNWTAEPVVLRNNELGKGIEPIARR